MLEQNSEIVGADEVLTGAASAVEETMRTTPHQKLGKAKFCLKTSKFAPSPTPTPLASVASQPTVEARGDDFSDEGQVDNENQRIDALIGDIVEQHRYRWQMIRARQRLELQGQAFCRNFCDGDKVKASKIWKEVSSDPSHPKRAWLQPFFLAMEPLLSAQRATEKKLTKLAKRLPEYQWAKSVPGLGEVSLTGIIGSLGARPGEYKSVSAVWKRMGLAVIYGERQRRVSGDAAKLHGYDAERRSLMWNIGDQVATIKSIRKPKDSDGNVIGEAYAINRWGQLYLDHKALVRSKSDAGQYADIAAAFVKAALAKRNKPNPENLTGRLSNTHIHNRAKRYVEKRLLRELWQVSRQLMSGGMGVES